MPERLTVWWLALALSGVLTEAVRLPLASAVNVVGLPLALSVMLTQAVRLPLAAGVNVTLIVQWAPAATELPHVLL